MATRRNPEEARTATPTWNATGRRKEASARVRLAAGTGKILVNGRDVNEYFRRDTLKMVIDQPFEVIEQLNQYDVFVTVRGGGLSGQAGAVRHGISRALCSQNVEYRPVLKKGGFLVRDARMKERKKYGRKAARARFQFSKR
jgi:small subunit ribosomal protein S9